MSEPSQAFIDTMENLEKIANSLQKLIDRANEYHAEKAPRLEKYSIINEKIEKLEHTFDLVFGKKEEPKIELNEEEEEDLEALTAPEITPINPYQ